MTIESMMLSNHLILYCLLLLLPSIFPSIRVISNESALYIRWPKYLSFSFSISPSNEYSGLIYFKTDWCDLLAVQGTLKSLLQHHSRSLFSKWSESAVILSGTLSSCCWSWRRLLVLTGLALSKPPKVQEHGDSKGSWWHRLTWLLAFLREPNTIQNRTLIPHCWPRTLVQS